MTSGTGSVGGESNDNTIYLPRSDTKNHALSTEMLKKLNLTHSASEPIFTQTKTAEPPKREAISEPVTPKGRHHTLGNNKDKIIVQRSDTKDRALSPEMLKNDGSTTSGISSTSQDVIGRSSQTSSPTSSRWSFLWLKPSKP